jgi:peptidoglycan/xylan/chitin deacetylase (PgdA/CDA1 family)
VKTIRLYATALLALIPAACENYPPDAKPSPRLSPVPVLMYHGVIEGDRATRMDIPVSRFRKHMEYLKSEGCQTVLTGDYAAFLKGERKPPDKPVMITFDDGTRGQFELARPILNELDFKAVFFVVTTRVERSEAGPEMIKTLSAEGHEIGSHTVHHFYLAQKNCDKKWKCCRGLKPCADAEVRRELVQSKNYLESILKRPVTSIAWPGNFFSDRTVKLAFEAGYKSTFAVEDKVMEDGVQTSRPGVTKGPELIYRTEIGGRCELEHFRKAVKSRRCCVVSDRKFHRYCVPRDEGQAPIPPPDGGR